MKNNDSDGLGLSKLLRSLPSIPILVICLFEIFGLFLLPSTFVSEESTNLGNLYKIYLIITGILSITIIYTLWKMKKIGILVYIGSYALHNVVALIIDNWMIGVIIIPLIGLILIGISRHKFK